MYVKTCIYIYIPIAEPSVNLKLISTLLSIEPVMLMQMSLTGSCSLASRYRSNTVTVTTVGEGLKQDREKSITKPHTVNSHRLASEVCQNLSYRLASEVCQNLSY